MAQDPPKDPPSPTLVPVERSILPPLEGATVEPTLDLRAPPTFPEIDLSPLVPFGTGQPGTREVYLLVYLPDEARAYDRAYRFVERISHEEARGLAKGHIANTWENYALPDDPAVRGDAFWIAHPRVDRSALQDLPEDEPTQVIEE